MLGRAERDELRRRLEESQRQVARLQQQVENQSKRDQLTGLIDVGEFMNTLVLEAGRAARYGRPLTVARIDIDDFESLNVQHGRAVVDRALVAAAEALRGSVRAHDVVARVGGDEFALLLPETDPAGAMACVERILRVLENLEAAPVRGLRASVGLAAHSRTLGPEAVFAAAGGAAAAAHAAGGNRIEVAGASVGASLDVQSDAAIALLSALEERDAWTAAHSRAVADMSAVIAQKLGLTAEVETVRMAGLLHDIGKIAVPEALLNKPEELDEAEWALLRDVPLAGERILRAVPGLGAVARIVRHVHEHSDGGGYPDGLAGEQIPVGARIIAAIDAYHSMTTPRPYRRVMSHERAVHELIAQAGNQFDDEVTEIVIGYVNGLRQAGAWEVSPAT